MSDDHGQVAGEPVVEVAYEPDCTLVLLCGEIDAAVSDDLTAVTGPVLEAAAPVVVDTSKVTFLDSVGVSFLVRLATRAREEGRVVTLRGTPPAVREVLALVGASSLFETV